MKRVILLMLMTGSLLAQHVELDLSTGEKRIFIGDRVRITGTVRAPRGLETVLPQAGKHIRDLVVISQEQRERTEGDIRIQSMHIQATAFDTGFAHIPALPLISRDPASPQEADTLYFPDAYIYVRSVLDTAESPVAMRAPLPLSPMTWWEYLVAALLLTAAVLILIWGLRKRRTGTEEKAALRRSPEEKAERALGELREKDYPQTGEWKRFYLELSFILRAYFEDAHYIHLHELSTTELLPVLKLYALPEHDGELREFFRFADLVKFARASAGRERCEKDLAFVRTLIEEDRIQRETFNDNRETGP